MAGPGSSDRDPVLQDPGNAQAHITTFWNTVAADYEAHGGNVAEYGSAQQPRRRRALPHHRHQALNSPAARSARSPCHGLLTQERCRLRPSGCLAGR
jgi:hypothetical protein